MTNNMLDIIEEVLQSLDFRMELKWGVDAFIINLINKTYTPSTVEHIKIIDSSEIETGIEDHLNTIFKIKNDIKCFEEKIGSNYYTFYDTSLSIFNEALHQFINDMKCEDSKKHIKPIIKKIIEDALKQMPITIGY